MEEILVQKMKSIMHDKPKDEDNFEKLFEITIQQMIDTNREIRIKHASKNKEIATKKLEAGNKIISTAPLKEVLRIYNEAVAHAPCGSDILARAFANRSARLTNGAMYEESLKDIERALAIGYPDNLKAKLYARKAKNLFALNKKMSPEVEEAVTQANMWSEKMDESNKHKVMSSLDQLQTQSLEKPIKKWDDSFFMPKMCSENPKILRASAAIDIQVSEKFGRHIVATKDIKAGEAVMVHKAYSAILTKECWRTYCSNCIKFTFSCVPCNNCSNVVYCDEKCRDEAWKEHHDIECPIVDGLVSLDAEKIEVYLSSLRIFIKALKEYSNVETLYKKVQELDQMKDSIDKILTGGIFDDTKYASVYGMLQKDSDLNIPPSVVVSIQTLYMLAATTDCIFGKKVTNFNELKNIDYGMFVAKLLFQHLRIVRTNAIKMMPHDDEGNVVNSGGVLLPLLSLFSHSCDCNAYQYASGNTSAVVAIQPIKKGEQICISYGQYYRDAPTRLRREVLMLQHHFLCECMPCNNNWGPNYRPSSCLVLNKRRQNMTKLLQVVKRYEKFPLIVMSYKVSTRDKSPTDILKTISEITDLLNTYDKYVSYPCAEIEHAKNLLLNIYILVAGY